MEFKRRASVMALVSSYRRRRSSVPNRQQWREEESSGEINNRRKNYRDHTEQDTDGGWGWVVVAGAFFALMMEMGMVQTLGVFVVPLEEEFESGAAVMGIIASSCFATLCAVCPVGSLLVKKIGCRKTAICGGLIMGSAFIISSFMSTVLQLFLCLDVLAGAGAALIHMSATIVIGQYFNKRYALANGLAYTGQGFGLFIFPNLLQKLIEEYGWRGTLMIEGAITFNIIAMVCLFRPIKRRKSPSTLSLDEGEEASNSTLDKEAAEIASQQTNDAGSSEKTKLETVVACTTTKGGTPGTTKVMLTEKAKKALEDHPVEKRQRFRFKCTCKVILETPTVLVIYFIFLFQALGFVAVTSHIVPQALTSGIPPEKATFTLSALGIGSLLGRAVHGIIIDRKIVSPKMGMTLSFYLCVGATLVNPLVGVYGAIIACAGLVGFASGWFFPLMQVVLRKMVGLQRLPSAYGLGMFFEGVGCATGGYIAGYVKDLTGSYDPAFYFISGTFAIAAITLSLEQLCRRIRRSKKKNLALQKPYDML